jgi:integrase
MKVFQRSWTAALGSTKSSWCVRFHDPTTAREVKRTLKGVATKREADAAAALIFADVTRRAMLGKDAGPSLAQRNLTLGRMLADDVKRSGIAESTRRTEREGAHTPLVRFFGEGRAVVALDGREIERFRKWRLDAGLSVRSANLPLQVLRAAINRAVADGRLYEAPCRIKLLADRPKQRRALTRDEAAKLIEAAAEFGIADEVTVLLATGLRRGELFSVEWRDVDFDRRRLAVRTTKRGTSGTFANDRIPLNAAALDVLRQRAERFPKGKAPATDLIFGVRPERRRASSRRKAGRPVGSEGGAAHTRRYRFNDKLKRAATAAGLDRPEQITAHSLRHSAATLLIEAGAGVQSVQRIMRHRDPATTLGFYLHARAEGLAEAAAALDFRGASIVPVARPDDSDEAIG